MRPKHFDQILQSWKNNPNDFLTLNLRLNNFNFSVYTAKVRYLNLLISFLELSRCRTYKTIFLNLSSLGLFSDGFNRVRAVRLHRAALK